jgi:hypothetical protein
MAHELEINENGTARFAYAIGGGVPWHRLGVPLEGLQTVEAILAAAGADYDVHLTRVAAVDEDGNFIVDKYGKPIIIDDSRATIRDNGDGTFNGLSTVGTRYVVKQNKEVAQRALAVVGASEGEAVVDTAGVLQDGRRFFMTIDLGSLVIDPMGVNDRIARYLVVSTGMTEFGRCGTPIPIFVQCATTLFVLAFEQPSASLLPVIQRILIRLLKMRVKCCASRLTGPSISR